MYPGPLTLRIPEMNKTPAPPKIQTRKHPTTPLAEEDPTPLRKRIRKCTPTPESDPSSDSERGRIITPPPSRVSSQWPDLPAIVLILQLL